MDLDVAHQELEIDEMISSYEGDTHMDDFGIDVADFMQHIDTKHQGHHVADGMETFSWT